MNFKEIRQEIFSALDYNPDLAAYRDQVSRVVNRHYQHISTQFPWLFLQKVETLSLKATVSGSSTSTITSPALTDAGQNWRLVTCSTSAFTEEMEGQTLVDGASEYTIQQYISGTQVILSTTPTARFNASTTWSVEFRRYPLPDLATEVLGVMSRHDDRGRLMYIDRRKEEEHFLDKDTTGDATIYIEDEFIIDRPPEIAPTLSATTQGAAATNPLLNSTEYQYCYTHTREGRETPPSLVSSVTTASSGEPQITISGLDNVQWRNTVAAASWQDSGVISNIYRRDKTNNGAWFRIAEMPSTDQTYVDDELFTAFSSESGTSTAYNYGDYLILDFQQPRPYMRFWYTPGSDMDVEVRYLIGMRRLHADQYVPEWPAAYHSLLVYRSLQDICLMNEMAQQAGIYEGRANILLNQMKAKYLARNERILVRRGFDKQLYERERWGIPSKTG